MIKLCRQIVAVEEDTEGNPISFNWQRKSYRVLRFEAKKSPRIPFKSFFQEEEQYMCLTDQKVICMLIKEGKDWIIERVWNQEDETHFTTNR